MKRGTRIEVVPWSDSGTSVISASRGPGRFVSPAMIGLLGTLLLHASIMGSLLLISRSHPVHLPEILEPAGANAKVDSAENLTLIALPIIASVKHPIVADSPDLRTLNVVALAMPTEPDPPDFSGVESLALNQEEESAMSATSGDGAERARLLGIYTGQIQARIERMWRRPRTPVNERASPARAAYADDSFQCQVQIAQDSMGNVQEILLPHCNGSQAWQRSLVIAIQQASPLPAPPSPKVFSHAMTLMFIGNAYVDGGSEDAYETPALVTGQATAHRMQSYSDPVAVSPLPDQSAD